MRFLKRTILMARVDHIEIYKAAYRFSLALQQSVARFPRQYRFSVGDALINASIRLIDWIYRANSEKDKER
jgi:hypothetical protein